MESETASIQAKPWELKGLYKSQTSERVLFTKTKMCLISFKLKYEEVQNQRKTARTR